MCAAKPVASQKKRPVYCQRTIYTIKNSAKKVSVAKIWVIPYFEITAQHLTGHENEGKDAIAAV